jgi:AcrR family transcriptional regulator
MPQKTSRRDEILLAALQCFSEAGIEATSIEMIRARCGASIGSIYHHHGSKEGIVAALFMQAMDDQSARLLQRLQQAPDLRSGLRELVLNYVDWVARHKEWARFAYAARAMVAAGPQAAALQERNRRFYGEVAAWLQAHGAAEGLRPLPPELVLPLIVGPAESYCRAWIAGRAKASPAKYRDELADAAWRAVAPAQMTTPGRGVPRPPSERA